MLGVYDERKWVMMLGRTDGANEQDVAEEFLVDSGATTPACPHGFASRAPT